MTSHVIAETTRGRIRGITDRGVSIFKGIPYGRSPDGMRRLRPPVSPESWPGVRETLEYGPRALQNENAFGAAPEVFELYGGHETLPMDEDCLVLNLWTPALNDGGRRPVMFWCHGGAFIAGSGSTPWSDGGNLARNHDLVVVTINHRLGALGYLHLEDLCGEEFAASGLAGMFDIIAALRWVRENVAAFGGDPDNVTLFGESGGGAKISVLMAMPAAQGLFHRAIIQSGPAVQMASRDEASATAAQLLEELGLTAASAGELRRVPPARILAAQAAVLGRIGQMSFTKRRRVGFNPVVDGNHLPAGPFEPVAPRLSASVPLMIGTNKDEMRLFFARNSWFEKLDEAAMRERVRMFVDQRPDAIAAAYRRARPDDSARDLFCAIASDAGMRIPSLTMAERKLALGAAPVFVYLFTWETPALGGCLKSPHTLEIPFVFDNIDSAAIAGDSPTRFALAETMSRTWAAFARSGNPNNDLIPEWPAYSSERRPTMIFDDRCRLEFDPCAEERRAWDSQ
ncbi:MAG TPA: carboxylesterase/lipase family protein [Candidatus Binataceae bacterium]|nr:carboxylesterase/lipase family protein [Candidatus Binataceae bacterium]